MFLAWFVWCFFFIKALIMKKLTREEATQLPRRPNGNFSFIRGYLMAMKPGDFILLEKKDWTRKTQVPSTYCLWLSRKEKGEWRCETLLDKTGWVIERVR